MQEHADALASLESELALRLKELEDLQWTALHVPEARVAPWHTVNNRTYAEYRAAYVEKSSVLQLAS
jgi:hypothetical protein